MKKIKTTMDGNVLAAEDIKGIDLDHIFDCGQCFRWERNDDGSYTGIAFGRPVRMEYDGSTLRIHNSTVEDFEGIWRHYLDLDRDYEAIKKVLAEKDPVIRKAMDYGYGIRILNQEKWETLLSFIISQNNNIPRIKKCIKNLAELMGEPAGEFGGRTWYDMPSPERLAAATVEDLAPCRLGYRARYLIETAGMVMERGMDDLERLGDGDVSYRECIEELTSYAGVGPKVANCISLFSMGKFNSFPIDTWVKKVMNRLYGIDEKDMKGMAAFAADNFGEYGGIAQQYLFYYITHSDDI